MFEKHFLNPIKMKKLAFIALLLINFSLANYAQPPKPQAPIIDSIAKANNCTIIPNSDFDEFVANKVSAKVAEEIQFYCWILGGFLFAVGGLAIYSFNNKVKQLVAEEVHVQSEDFQSMKAKILELKAYALRSDMEAYRKKFDKNTFIPSPEEIAQATRMLDDSKELKNKELIAEIVDLLALSYKCVQSPKEIDKLIVTNESECEIRVETYMNAAILYMDLYELDGFNWYKENCLKYSDKAAKKLPQYGEPQGITLLMYGIDYYNSTDAKEKETMLANAKASINEILKGSDPMTAYFTVARIEKDRANGRFKKYITDLEGAISVEFQKLYNKAKEYENKINPIV
jgi:hypothetical protein